MYKDWLAEKDAIISSHLEHELTAQDLPDETQVIENITFNFLSFSYHIFESLSLIV